MSLTVQALSILHMILAGICIGLAYDTYSRLRLKYKNKALTIIQDLLFWIATGLFIFIWLKAINQGDVRVYVFLALLCGFAMYKSIFQSFYRKILDQSIQLIVKIYKWIIHLGDYLIIQPLKRLVAIVIFIMGSLLTLLLSLLYNIYYFLKFCCKPFQAVGLKLYKKINKLFSRNQKKIERKNKEEKKGFASWVAKWFNRKRS